MKMWKILLKLGEPTCVNTFITKGGSTMGSRMMKWTGTSIALAAILSLLLLGVLGALPGAVSAQSPGGEVIYSTEYMNASQALQDATLQDDEIQREKLLREAVQWYTADLEKRSTDVAVTYNNRAVAYARLGEYELAIADYNVALELSPRSADFIKNRGLAYEQMGNLECALADFKAFLDRIADMPSARREEEYLYFSDKVVELRESLRK